MTTQIRRSRLALVAATAVAMTTVLGGGDAFAEPETQTVTINACTDAHGNLRVVEDPTTCKKNETPISWNVQGPQGLQGPQGEPGPQGLPGEIGPVGPQGEKGDKGDVGPIGPRGLQGERGFTGSTGPAGPQGPQGLKGDTGATGAVGPRGATGPQGPQGFQGPQGLKGDTGAQGLRGTTGPQGPQGLPGAQGPSGVVESDFASGGGFAPSASVAFLAPTAFVNVAANQMIHVSSQRALGSTVAGGARGLRLDVCYQSTASGSTIQGYDNDAIWNLAVPQGLLMPFALSAQIAFLPAGQYRVGLCGLVANADPAAWNSSDWGCTSAFVTQA